METGSPTTTQPGAGPSTVPGVVPGAISVASPALMVLANTAEAAAAARDAGFRCTKDVQNSYQECNSNTMQGTIGNNSTSTETYQNGGVVQGQTSFAPTPILAHPPNGEHQIASPTGNSALNLSTSKTDCGSAFVPVKKLKLDEVNEKGVKQLQSEGTTQEGEKEGTNDRPDSVTSRSSTGSAPDESRFLRRTVRKRTEEARQVLCCPICGITMRSGDITNHLQGEIEKLNKLSKPRKSLSKEVSSHGKKNSPSPSTSSNGSSNSKKEVTDGELPVARYDTYLRVRASRQTRLAARGKGKKKRSDEETVCPVCSEKIVGTSEELNDHVDQCLKQKGEDDEEVDVEGEFEEYTWAGQTRIRATSFVEGGLAEAGFKKVCKSEADEDVDLCVDDDDVDVYGNPQYTEADIIPCSTEDPNEDKQSRALRRAYLRAENLKAQKPELTDRVKWQQNNHSNESGNHSNHIDGSKDSSPGESESNVNGAVHPACTNEGALEEVIESLKVRIKEQEEQLSNKQEPPKCLICMEIFHKPTTSVQCWHVHCEECWLRTLGAKKLCPQCNMITSPADLRRIYL